MAYCFVIQGFGKKPTTRTVGSSTWTLLTPPLRKQCSPAKSNASGQTKFWVSNWGQIPLICKHTQHRALHKAESLFGEALV